MANLDPLFKPRGIAIIGASNRPLTIGHRILTNLLRYGFSGPVFPVNPKGGEILEQQCFPSILDVPGQVDLAHVIVRNTMVAQTLEDCAAKGVKVAIINTSGFRETGAKGLELEQELKEIGRRTGLRLFGPNCQGVMNSDPEVSLYSNFTFAFMTPGHVSIVAQGGGVAEVINNYFGMNGVGQRMYASNGNACDISIPEIIEYYGQDDQTHVIVLHVESFADPREYIERVGPVAAVKPVLALKSGTTVEGARAVSSHTGGLMEQDTVTDVLFDRCGVLRFTSLSDLCQAAQAFATQQVPAGNRVGMVTNAGSPAIIITDEAVKAGLRVPDLSQSSKDALSEKLQSMASIANPIDMMATASGPEFGASLQTLVQDPNIDAAVICFMTPFFVDTLGIAAAIEEQAKGTDKTLIAVAMTNPDEKPEWRETVARVRAAGVPVYYFPEKAARVLYHMDRYRCLRDRMQDRDREKESLPALDIQSQACVDLLEQAHLSADGFMSAKDASALLRAYGIPIVQEGRARTWEDLRAVAAEIDYPVVLKAESPTLLHKTESQAVVLNLRDPGALKQAFDDLQHRLGKHQDLSFLVQKQLSKGLEVIIGGARAANLGGMVMFGLGGIHVEVLKDVTFKLAPFSRLEALQMLDSIAAAPLLKGVRGQAGVDPEALADILMRVGRLLEDQPRIQELDLNPVIVPYQDQGDGQGDSTGDVGPGGVGPRVVDVRVKLSSMPASTRGPSA